MSGLCFYADPSQHISVSPQPFTLRTCRKECLRRGFRIAGVNVSSCLCFHDGGTRNGPPPYNTTTAPESACGARCPSSRNGGGGGCGRAHSGAYRAYVTANPTSFDARNRWVETSGRWASPWGGTSLGQCRHGSNCNGHGQNHCGNHLEGAIVKYWPNGCGGPAWDIRCEVELTVQTH